MVSLRFVKLRKWQKKDIPALMKQANNYHIWLNLTDNFPHPYTENDAEGWIELNAYIAPAQNLAIVVNGKLAGGIGLVEKQGNWARTAEIGYWLGEEFWGQGIMTRALKKFVSYVFEAFPEIYRLEANVVSYNAASSKVLEKSGFICEGILKKRFLKNDKLWDIHFYAILKEDKRKDE